MPAFMSFKSSTSLVAFTASVLAMLFTMAILFSVGPAYAQGASDPESIRGLDAKCEQARAARLAPVRRDLAKQCEQEPRRGTNKEEECRLETSTYGDTFRGPRGAAIEGMFYDLPECMAARAAWQKWEKDQPWKK
ncbi:MAG: hypothetical protein JWR22_829 [Herminiimonas sp.]|nr:hypothetical protein [Herminiimonas sp.]